MNKIIFLSAIAALSLMTACHADHDHAGEEAQKEESHKDSDEIVLEPEDAERFGVRTAIVTPSQFNEIVAVSGQIVSSPEDRAVVVAPASGIVRLAPGVTDGMKVSAGASIATVSSRGVTGGDPNEGARIAMEAAKRELDRLTPLLDDGIITRREYNAARQAYDAARAAYSGNAASGRAASPIAGTVTQVMVKEGEYVETGTPIATVSKNTRLTLRADLPERYMSFVNTITSANFRPAYSDSTFTLADMGGRLVSPANAAGELKGYIPVYFSFDNNGTVAPGASAEIYLIGRSRTDALTVPVAAVTEAQGTHYVYVKKSEHGYEKRPVKLGNSDGKSVEILSGLNAGEEAVTENVTFVRLAESSGAVPEGHSHNH